MKSEHNRRPYRRRYGEMPLFTTNACCYVRTYVHFFFFFFFSFFFLFLFVVVSWVLPSACTFVPARPAPSAVSRHKHHGICLLLSLGLPPGCSDVSVCRSMCSRVYREAFLKIIYLLEAGLSISYSFGICAHAFFQTRSRNSEQRVGYVFVVLTGLTLIDREAKKTIRGHSVCIR